MAGVRLSSFSSPPYSDMLREGARRDASRPKYNVICMFYTQKQNMAQKRLPNKAHQKHTS